MLTRLRSVIRALVGRNRFEDSMAEEMRFHIDSYASELQREGLTASEAARRARMEFGTLDALKDDCRQSRGLRWFEELQQDLRYTARLMRKTPGFTAAAMLSLGLGIGANTAIFSLVDAVLLRSLPVTNPHELFFLAHGEGEYPATNSNYPLLERFRTAPVFSGVTAYRTATFKVANGDRNDLVPGMFVSGNFHAVIGIPVILGRGFTAESDRATDGNPIAVISDAYWMRRFGRAPDVLGKTLTIQGRIVSIVGVTTAEFTALSPGARADITLPLSMYVLDEPNYLAMHDTFTGMPLIARVKAGVSEAQALAVIDPMFRQYMSEPENQWAIKMLPKVYTDARLMPAGKGGYSFRQQYSTPLLVLMGMVALVLLVASANVANLQLARAAARSKEVAIRLCVGGGRSRLIRQFLTESTVLSLAGALLGIVFAWWGTELIVAMLATYQQTVTLDVSPNVRVLAFTAAIATTTGIAFGLAPALKTTRVDLAPSLKESGPQGPTRRRAILGRALVAGQVALCVVVVAVAALLGRSVHNLKAQNAGFEPANVAVFALDIFSARFTRAQLESHYMTIVERLHQLPGVIAVSASRTTPIHTSGNARTLSLPDKPEGITSRAAWTNQVSAEYFDTLGVRLLRGRPFTSDDRIGSPPVAIINQSLATYVFGDADPVGRTIAFGNPRDKLVPLQIVGVTQDTQQMTLREPAPRTIYTPLLQEPEMPGRLMVAMKVARLDMQSANQLARSAREIVRGVTPDLVFDHFRTMEEQIDASLVRERALLSLSTTFAALALLLACVGLYGVMSYTVTRRTREIGIRLALGARRGTVVAGVLREIVALSAAGIVVGLGVTLLATKTVSTFLYGLSPRDPLTLAAVSVVLVATTLLAGYLPARRAAGINPVRAIRTE